MIYEKINLWDDMPCYEQVEGANIPFMTVYSLSNTKEVDINRKRPAILVCPGGGYHMTSDREAEPIMVNFLSQGYVVFVLRYSVSPATHPQPILDVSRAMWLIRENADAYNVDSDRIGVIGFSAGGHLAAHLGVAWNQEFISDLIGMPKGINKPNALILCYPVISYNSHQGSFKNLLGNKATEEELHALSCELHVGAHTPPTFLWHTFNDNVVPVENSLVFAKSLRDNDIPFELHIYPDGKHGLSVCTREVAISDDGINEYCADWMPACLKWTNLVLDNKQF